MNNEQVKISNCGFHYYEKVPEDYHLADIQDFILDGKLNLGMRFLIKWLSREDFFEINTVTNGLRSEFLIPFVEDQRVFPVEQGFANALTEGITDIVTYHGGDEGSDE